MIQEFYVSSLHHTALSHRQSKLSQTEGKVKTQYKKSIEQNQTNNAKVRIRRLIRWKWQQKLIYQLCFYHCPSSFKYVFKIHTTALKDNVLSDV